MIRTVCKRICSSGSLNDLIRSVRFYGTENPENAIQTEGEFPKVEMIRRIIPQTFSKKNYAKEKFGDYELTICKEGFIQVFTKGLFKYGADAAGYASVFGIDHPLNRHGTIAERPSYRLADFNATLIALEAIDTLPRDKIEKICFNTDSLPLIKSMGHHLKIWSENNYHSLVDPSKTLENLEIVMKLNKLMRSNSNVLFRWKYAPSDCLIPLMDEAVKLAKIGSF